MKRLLLLLFVLLFHSCNQQTILYGSGTIATREFPISDSVKAVHIQLDARPISIIYDTINKISFTTDDNLFDSYSLTYDSTHYSLRIAKTADQQLLTNAFQYTLHLKNSPEKIEISNCTLYVDERLNRSHLISVSDNALITCKNDRDSLSVEISDQSSVSLSGRNKTQDIRLLKGAHYRYSQTSLYTAWVDLSPHSRCTLAVEKYIYGSIAAYGVLAIKGIPLVQTTNETKAKITYIE